MNREIIPSVLAYTADELVARLDAVGGFAPTVQLDVLDNTLIPYQDFHDPQFIDRLPPKASFEVHLMVKDAQAAIPKWNYPWVKKLIFHLEANVEPREGCRLIRSLGKSSGIAISPKTPFVKALPYLPDVDTILVMTVEPGRNGAPFLPEMLDKVRALRAAAPDVNIEVDGGVSLKTIKSCVSAGANLFVVGSYLKNGEFASRMQVLKQALQ